MRKLKLFAVTAITIVFASCSKDEATKPIQPQHMPVTQQVMDLIRKADFKLYNNLYGNRAEAKTTKDHVRYLPGVFYIPRTGLDDATCLGTDNVCMVIIDSPKKLDPGPDATMITSDVDETYDPGTAELIINDSDNPTATPVTALKVSIKGDGAGAIFSYKQ